MIRDASAKERKHTVEFTVREVVKALRGTSPTYNEFPRTPPNEESFVVTLDEETQMLYIAFTTAIPK